MTAEQSNLVLITLDAFNFRLLLDHLDSLPNIKKLMEHGVVFRNAFSTGPKTPFSFPGIIGGVYASDFGVGISEHLKTIDQIAAEAGYHTAFIDEANDFLTPYFGYGRNIHYSRYLMELSPFPVDRKLMSVLMETGGSQERKGKPGQIRDYLPRISNRKFQGILSFALRIRRFIKLYAPSNPANYRFRTRLHEEFVAEIEEFFQNIFEPPQFIWLHSMANHLPYLPPPDTRFSGIRINYLNFRALADLPEGSIQELKSLYIDSLRTTDDFIAKVIGALETTGRLDRSIVILTADHGEEFMEEGFVGHQIQSCSNSLLNVPLIFYAPKMFKGRSIDAPVSTLDILPTICDLLSVEKPVTARGFSLLDILMNKNAVDLESKFWMRPIFSEGWRRDELDRGDGVGSPERVFAVRMNTRLLKLKQSRTVNGTIEEEYIMRDWIKNENLNLDEHREEFVRLGTLLREHMTRHTEAAVHMEPYTQAEEEMLRRRLANLGYM